MLGIPFDVTDEAGKACIETLGLEFEFGEWIVLRNIRSRAWKLWLATSCLLKRKRVSGDVLRVWLGHVNFYFQLGRSALASLSAVYKFSHQHIGRRAVMWPITSGENFV